MNLKSANIRLGLNKFISCEEKSGEACTLLDPSISSFNLGDEIISRSCLDQLSREFGSYLFYRLPTHIRPSSKGIYHANNCDYRILCGSNLIRSNLFRGGNWNLSLFDILRYKPLITLGVGWNKYSEGPDRVTSVLYRLLLDKCGFHSVRDSYTLKKFKEMGVENVINTGCPSLWSLTKAHCLKIPRVKSDRVVLTLTDYSQDRVYDQFLVEFAMNNYRDVYFWGQGSGDINYLNALGKYNITVIPSRLEAFDEFLRTNEEVDYIGTRLHGGIRALQYQRRSIIVSVDNRAREMSKDFNLPVIEREKLMQDLEVKVYEPLTSNISIDEEAVSLWLSQFNS